MLSFPALVGYLFVANSMMSFLSLIALNARVWAEKRTVSGIVKLMFAYLTYFTITTAIASVDLEGSVDFVGVLASAQSLLLLMCWSCLAALAWLWLYVAAVAVLIAARRFDLLFRWLMKALDIEKKPLQSIGVMAFAVIVVLGTAAILLLRLG